MEFITPLILLPICFYIVVVFLKKIEKNFLTKIKYSQSYFYNISKQYKVVKTEKIKKTSQLSERLDKSSISVVVLDNKAYWVANNIFYSANFIDGKVETDSIRPIDSNALSKEDLDKMLLILDKLGDGNNSDSGGTR